MASEILPTAMSITRRHFPDMLSNFEQYGMVFKQSSANPHVLACAKKVFEGRKKRKRFKL